MSGTELSGIEFSTDDIFSSLKDFSAKNINEFSIHDKKIASNKDLIKKLVRQVLQECPGLFVSLPVDVRILDRDLLLDLMRIYSCLEIELSPVEKNGALLLDKKLYSNKARLLNEEGALFGFDMDFAVKNGDTFKLFRDRIDFAVSLYPNHIDFAQLADPDRYEPPRPTAVFSSKDIDFSRGLAFACITFYSAGRAVPWFLSVLSALRISASALFLDFEEWQQCNNCSFETGFNPEQEGHEKIEKMQLLFLKQKFEEKHKPHLYSAVENIVRLNGAMSRLAAENLESVLDLNYNPDDLFSPYAMNIESFADNVVMQDCRVKIFLNKDGEPDYKIL